MFCTRIAYDIIDVFRPYSYINEIHLSGDVLGWMDHGVRLCSISIEPSWCSHAVLSFYATNGGRRVRTRNLLGDFSLANPSTFSLSLRQHPQASISSLLFILSSMFCVNPSTFSNRYPNTHRQQVIDVFHPFIDVLHQSIDVFPALPKHPQATIHRCFSTFHRYFHPIEFEPRAKKPSIPGCMAAIPGGLVAIPGP